jgi:hypothetical protein
MSFIMPKIKKVFYYGYIIAVVLACVVELERKEMS